MYRRSTFRLAALLACLAGSWFTSAAMAQANTQSSTQSNNWPNRPINLVVPQAAGGGTDVLGRLWADYVGKSLKTPVIVENRAGANGIVAASYVAKQPADGYTLMVAGISYLAFNPFTYKSLPYNPERDFEGVALLVNTPFLLVASKDTGIQDLNGLIAKAKAAPNGLNFSSAGKGNSTHLIMEMLQERTGTKLTHVPYNGAAKGLTGVMSGEVQLMSDVLNTAAVQAKADKVNPIAVIGSQRANGLPNVPTIAEAGLKDFPQPGWYALVAPAGTPQPIIERLNAETQKFFADPAVLSRLEMLNYEPLPGSAAQVKNWMRRDAQTWGPIITRLGISND